MKVDVMNIEGKKVKTVEVPKEIFEAPINMDLMHQAYVRQMANARLGTRKTKGRSEVSGGGRKPWRQKGTGRARQGSIRAAQWVGGGKIFTPQPRDFSKKMPRKMRRAALRSVLSVRMADDGFVFLDDMSLPEPKTRIMNEVLEKLVGDASVLVILPNKEEKYEQVARAFRNIPDAKTLLANYVNVRDILKYEKVILPIPALDVLVSFLG